MANTRACERCGKPLSDAATENICPACIAQLGHAPWLEETVVDPRTHREGAAMGASVRSSIANPKSQIQNRRVRYFGDYELLEEIAHGGMGVVYKARQVSLNRVVAVKMIRAGLLASEVDIRRFRTEAEAAGSLQHPNIVTIHEVGEHEDQHYFSMDYIEGRNLAQLVREHLWSAARAATCVKTIAEAIHYAHQRGILHRDLKPSNVVVDAADQPHITDFGLAKRLKGDSELTASGAILGTPSYMSPEQASGRRMEVGAPSDVYSLGAILYELLTGRPPFQGETLLDTVKLVLETEPVSPRLLNPKVPRDLETIALKCLAKESQRRYRSAQELAADLGRWLRHEPILARPSNAWERTIKWAKRKPVAAALVGVSCVAVMALIGALVAQVAFRTEQQLRGKAVEAYQTAERARSAEVEQRKLKEAALVEAERARQAETEARTMEARQRAIAEAALAKAERNQYLRRIAWAQREWDANSIASAEALLDECPEDLRHWEWHYLKRLCHSELLTLPAFTNGVHSVAVTSTGHRIAAVSADGLLKVWDATTGLEDFAFSNRLQRIASVAFTPSGTHLTTGSSNDGFVELWEMQTASKSWSSKWHGGHVTSLAHSVGGSRFVSASSDGSIFVRDGETGDSLQGPFEHGEAVNSVAITSDGKLMVSASGKPASVTPSGEPRPERPGTIKIWEVSTGRFKFALSNSVGVVYSLAISPEGKRLVSGHADATIKLWDMDTGLQESIFRGHVGDVFSVAFSADGSRVVSGSADRTMKVWALSTSGESVTYRGHNAEVHGVAFTGDGRYAVSASADGTVKLWDVTQAQEAITLEGGSMTLAFSPNGELLASGSNVWNVVNLNEEFQVSSGRFDRVTFSPNGKLLAKSRYGMDQGDSVWNVETHQIVPTHKIDGGYGVAFSPDGKIIAKGVGTYRSPGTVKMWEATTGIEVHSFGATTTNEIYDLAFSPDGKLLALAAGDYESNMKSGGQPGEVQLWDWKAQRLVRTLKARRFCVWGLAFSRDGKRLASAGGLYWGTPGQPRLGEVQVWDVETGDEVFDLAGVTDNVFNVAFSPDGKRLVAASGRSQGQMPVEVKIWDMETGLVAFTLRGFKRPVQGVAFSSDGQRIATAGSGTVKIFNAEKPQSRPAY